MIGRSGEGWEAIGQEGPISGGGGIAPAGAHANTPYNAMLATAEQIRNLFRNNGLRCTRQRELLYVALAATKSHPTAEELYQAAKGIDPELSLATVYNTLEALCEAGLCRKVSSSVSVGPCRYDADITDHVHVAASDGRVLDIPNDISDRLLAGVPRSLIDELERRLGVSIESVNLQLVAAPPRSAV
jgi:Fur family peroxide stress response transcriptional regulator